MKAFILEFDNRMQSCKVTEVKNKIPNVWLTWIESTINSLANEYQYHSFSSDQRHSIMSRSAFGSRQFIAIAIADIVNGENVFTELQPQYAFGGDILRFYNAELAKIGRIDNYPPTPENYFRSNLELAS